MIMMMMMINIVNIYISQIPCELTSVAWRSSQSGKARKRAHGQSDAGELVFSLSLTDKNAKLSMFKCALQTNMKRQINITS